MSLFGYPATIVHRQALIDNWGRVTGFYEDVPLDAKVVEEQKLIKSTSVDRISGEMVQSVIEIHLEGAHLVKDTDRFLYLKHYYNALGHETRYDPNYDYPDELNIRPLSIVFKKHLGTDDVKKVIVYG